VELGERTFERRHLNKLWGIEGCLRGTHKQSNTPGSRGIFR